MLKSNEKMCAFYASDYHFEMIILPYLNKEIEENNNIVIFTENNLKESIDVLISKVNLKEEKKEKILNLNWKNNDLEKFNVLKNYKKSPKETSIFIKGTKNYIKNINENLSRNVEESKFRIIDCYSIDDVAEETKQIANNYESVLTTVGENKLV